MTVENPRVQLLVRAGGAQATTSCKNVETLPRKKRHFFLIIAAPSSLPFKVVPPSFEHGLVLLATLIRGGGGITSTRSWAGYLGQNTVRYSTVSQVLLQLVVAPAEAPLPNQTAASNRAQV